ncbi:MAG: glycosyltransferase [Gammaproteobacteria bacterium]|nr:glycosyltransferase [Gammaproteobacteria bacterium]
MKPLVLVVASTVPRRPGDALPAFVLEQVAALQAAHPECDYLLLAPHEAGAAREEVLAGVGIRRFRYCWPETWQRLAYPAILPNLRRHPWLWLQVPLLFAAEFAAVIALSRSRRPAVIYSHWFAPQGIACGAAAWLLGIPHVLTTHAADAEVMRRLPLLGPAVVRGIARRLAAVTAVSTRTAGKLRGFFARPADLAMLDSRLRVLPMGTDVSGLRPATGPERLALQSSLGLAPRRTVLFLGRLTAKKGVDVLLQAFALVTSRMPDALLLIAGEGEERAALERAAAGASGVRFVGYVEGERKRDLLRAAEVFVLPSVVAADGDAEGLPVALLEALAAGLPCVATDASGAEELLADGVSGFIVPQRDPQALAEAMLRALTLGEAERAAVTGAARTIAERCDWPAIAAAHFRHLIAPFLYRIAP